MIQIIINNLQFQEYILLPHDVIFWTKKNQEKIRGCPASVAKNCCGCCYKDDQPAQTVVSTSPSIAKCPHIQQHQQMVPLNPTNQGTVMVIQTQPLILTKHQFHSNHQVKEERFMQYQNITEKF